MNEIVKLTEEIQSKGFYVFINYSGHINSITVYLTYNSNYTHYLSYHFSLKTLKDVERILKKFLSELELLTIYHVTPNSDYIEPRNNLSHEECVEFISFLRNKDIEYKCEEVRKYLYRGEKYEN